jgi:hypothetical protein
MNKLVTPEEMKAYIDATWEQCQAEARGEPVAIGWYIEGYGAVLGAVRPNLRYEEWRPFYAMRISPQRTWVGLTPDDFRQLEKETTVNGYNGDYCPTWDLIEAVEEKLKEKNT